MFESRNYDLTNIKEIMQNHNLKNDELVMNMELLYIYIYIYIYRERERERERVKIFRTIFEFLKKQFNI